MLLLCFACRTEVKTRLPKCFRASGLFFPLHQRPVVLRVASAPFGIPRADVTFTSGYTITSSRPVVRNCLDDFPVFNASSNRSALPRIPDLERLGKLRIST